MRGSLRNGTAARGQQMLRESNVTNILVLLLTQSVHLIPLSSVRPKLVRGNGESK